MTFRRIFSRFALLSSIIMLCFQVKANDISLQEHRSVIVRKVGHEILLMSGDSTSLVLPVTNANEKYRLRFATDFGFQPIPFAGRIDSILGSAKIHEPYLVQVLSCQDQSVVYSYQVGDSSVDDSTALVPCGVREYPTDCYEVTITFGVHKNEIVESKVIGGAIASKKSEDGWVGYLIVFGALLVIAVYFYRKRNNTAVKESHVIDIGAYKFDKRNMHLTFRDETVELTSKEADLLFLLHSSANQTIERDTILRIVWGDEGDYVGRTLDVFISKLRKKLAGDPAIKIANIRGVGYRLVLDVPGV